MLTKLRDKNVKVITRRRTATSTCLDECRRCTALRKPTRSILYPELGSYQRRSRASSRTYVRKVRAKTSCVNQYSYWLVFPSSKKKIAVSLTTWSSKTFAVQKRRWGGREILSLTHFTARLAASFFVNFVFVNFDFFDRPCDIDSVINTRFYEHRFGKTAECPTTDYKSLPCFLAE